jgi:RarD protein
MVIFGTIGLLVRYIDSSSSEIALLRGFFGSLFLLLVLLAVKQKIPWSRIRKNILLLLFSGAALACNWIFLFEAYRHTSISNAALSYYFAPVFLTILSPLVLKERLSAKKVICIITAMLGMLLIIGSGGGSASDRSNLLGIGFGLAAAGFYASLMLLNKFIRQLTGLQTTLIQLAVASLLLMPYVFITEGFSLFSFSAQSLILILILGIIHTGIGFFLFFSGMQSLRGQSIAVLSYIDPITSVAISAFILREDLTVFQIAGGVLLLGSIFISERNLSKPVVRDETTEL